MGGGRGVDADAVLDSVRTFEDRLGDCVVRVRYRNAGADQFDDVPVGVREARLTVAPGIRERGGYFDVRWWHNGDYEYHYRESGLQFRFGHEADDEPTSTPVDHFHPPSDPGDHRPSCVPSEHPPELVTLAVIANWLHAARESDPDLVNSLTDPP